MSVHAIFDPLLVMWLVGTTSIIYEAAKIAQVVNKSIQLCDVIRDVSNTWIQLLQSLLIKLADTIHRIGHCFEIAEGSGALAG